MKNQQIRIAQTRMHTYSSEFWEAGYRMIEPWFFLDNVMYDCNINELVSNNKKFVYPVYTTGHPATWLESSKGLVNILDKEILNYASKGLSLIHI